MIIWTRYGILPFLGLLAGAVVGSATLTAFDVPNESPQNMALMFWYGALISLMLTLWVFPRLDKPQLATFVRPLAQPTMDARGRTQKTEVVPATDPEGNQLFFTPKSTLFFIPARFYWIFFAVIALIPTAEWIFRR